MELTNCCNSFSNDGYKIIPSAASFTVLGVFSNYPFSLVVNNALGSKYKLSASFTFANKLSNAQARELKKYLRFNHYRLMSYTGVAVNIENVIDISYDPYIVGKNMLNNLTHFFAANSIFASDKCPICKLGNCDCAAIHNGVYTNAHLSCIQIQSSQAANSAVKQKSGNVFLGILGAFLGSFVGMLPTLLLMLLTQRIFALLYAIVPFCAFWAYKKFNGHVSKATVWIISIVSILQIFTIEVLYIYFSALIEGISISLGYAIAVYFLLLIAGGSDAVSLWLSLGQSALFMALGIWISWRYIRQTPDDIISSSYNIQTTITPYNTLNAPANTPQVNNNYSPANAAVGGYSSSLPVEMQDDTSNFMV